MTHTIEDYRNDFFFITWKLFKQKLWEIFSDPFIVFCNLYKRQQQSSAKNITSSTYYQ